MWAVKILVKKVEKLGAGKKCLKKLVLIMTNNHVEYCIVYKCFKFRYIFS